MMLRAIENKAQSVEYPYEWYGIAAIDYDGDEGDVGIYRIGKFDDFSNAFEAMCKFVCHFMADDCEIAFVDKATAVEFTREHGEEDDAEKVSAPAEGELEYIVCLGYVEVDMYDFQ